MQKYLTYKPKRVDHKFKKGVYVKILNCVYEEYIGVYGIITHSDRGSTDMRTKTFYYVKLPNIKNEVPVTQRSKVPKEFVIEYFKEEDMELATKEEWEVQQMLES